MTAAGHSPTSPRDAALRSRAHLKRTTELLTKVHARSRPLVLDLMDGRGPGVDGVSNTVHPLDVVSLAVRPGRPPPLHAGAPRRPRTTAVHAGAHVAGVAAVVMRRAPEPGIRGVAASSTSQVADGGGRELPAAAQGPPVAEGAAAGEAPPVIGELHGSFTGA